MSQKLVGGEVPGKAEARGLASSTDKLTFHGTLNRISALKEFFYELRIPQSPMTFFMTYRLLEL